MGLLRFLGLLFALICLFAGSATVVAALVLRFRPVLLIIVLPLLLFQRFMS